jgi:hypothetical protein
VSYCNDRFHNYESYHLASPSSQPVSQHSALLFVRG